MNSEKERGFPGIRPLGAPVDWSGAELPLEQAAFPVPFASGLEYAAPARGGWNIVHVGMLLPESHQIFVCAQGCLRGVVLTAAEMGAMDRFSTIAVQERNVMQGDMEELILSGVEDILGKLPQKPKAVLLFTSCIHHVIGCELNYVYGQLRQRFTDVGFTDCYMNPIMRKSKTPPDAKMRQQLYSFLKPGEQKDNFVNFIGNTQATPEDSELVQLIRKAGYGIRDICTCRTYPEYLEMGKSRMNITYQPSAKLAGDTLEKRLGQPHLHLSFGYGLEEIGKELSRAAEALGISSPPDWSENREKAEQALWKTAEAVKDFEISLDFTAAPRILSLTRLLVEHGFTVTSLYADSFLSQEQEDFLWLRQHAPRMRLFATMHPKMGIYSRVPEEKAGNKVLAIGQKAAYFTGTRHFVNLLDGGSLWGYGGICRLMEEIQEAAAREKDTQAIIQVKGWGCCG